MIALDRILAIGYTKMINTSKIIKVVIWICVTTFIASGIGLVSAKELIGLRLGIMPYSTHWEDKQSFLPCQGGKKGNCLQSYNENQEGKFLEYRLNDTDWIGAFTFINSKYRNSNGLYWMREHEFNEYLGWGYTVGGVTGYNKDRPVLFGTVNFTLRFGMFGIREAITLGVNGHQLYLEF